MRGRVEIFCNTPHKSKWHSLRNKEHRLKSGNICYLLLHNRLSSSLLSININIIIHRHVILPVVVYGCETWSIALRE